ncbi:MAG: hypothetical protein WAN51_12135 [Alphaproteobacteria bacterium]
MPTAILAICPVVAPDIVLSSHGVSRRVRLIALDGSLAYRRRLICSWHRDPEKRLVCVWESDVVPEVPADSKS